MDAIARTFLDDSRAFLKEYRAKIEDCLGQLTDDQIWHRPNEASNSIGNLMLHLAGSSRQWAVETIGGNPTGRDRQSEFDRRDRLPTSVLRAELHAAMEEVDRVLAALPPESLLETRRRRDYECTVLWCVYHIVEHFSMHTGQILSMTKERIGELAPSART